MPFYEGIGLIAEKNAVVFDLGSAYIKVGYAGESTPRYVFKTPAGVFDDVLDRHKLYESLVELIHDVYFRRLLVNPKDRRVVLVDDVLGPISVKEVVSEVLFKHFEVLSILYAPGHLLPLFTLGVNTGLVLDLGFKEATVMPVFEGVPVLKCWQAQPLASDLVHEEIRRLLKDKGTIKRERDQVRKAEEFEVNELADEVIEDIKVRLCFCTTLERGSRIQKINEDASQVSGLSSFLKKSVPSVAYPLTEGDSHLYVDGSVRESVCEVLFQRDIDGVSVPTLILDALLASSVDARKLLARNLVIVGGTSLIKGFKARLFEELRHLIDSDPVYKEKLSGEKIEFKLHVAPSKAVFTVWTGASLFGATDAIATRSFSRESYIKENCRVPDWSNLKFNSLVTCDTNEKQG